MDKKHISFSQLNMFLRCGEQYRRRYIEGHIIPPAGKMIRGKCCHKAEADNFKNKIEQQEFLSTEAVIDLFVTEWDASEHQIGWTEEELDGQSPKKAAGQMKDSGVRLVKVFNDEQLALCDPAKIEDEFTIEFEGGYLPLNGFIDRIDRGEIVAEEKFVGKSPIKDEIQIDVQMTNYDLGYRAKYGKPPHSLTKQWAVDLKTPKTVIQTCLPRTDDIINRYLNRLEVFMKALETGTFLPAANDAWCCSPKWCGYYQTCKMRR
jgi:hypothetical protein